MPMHQQLDSQSVLTRFYQYISEYECIIVIANAKKTNDVIKKIKNKKITKKFLFVVFNSVDLSLFDEVDHVCVIHRHHQQTPFFFGWSEETTKHANISHWFVCSKKTDIDSYSLNTERMLVIKKNYVSGYPINKKIFSFRNKNKYIESPTTGFFILSLLDELNKNNKLNIDAYGFGLLPNGYQGHAWSFERRALSKMSIVFYTHRFRRDMFLYFRGLLPDVFIRLYQDISVLSRKYIKR